MGVACAQQGTQEAPEATALGSRERREDKLSGGSVWAGLGPWGEELGAPPVGWLSPRQLRC